VVKDLTAVDSKLTQVVEEGNKFKDSVAKDINLLTDSTAAKYDIAETSSRTEKSLSKTAQKFREAENEAKVLSEETKLYDTLDDLVKKSVDIEARTKDTIKSVAETKDKFSKIRGIQTESLSYFDSSVAKSIELCRDQIVSCASKEQDAVSKFKYGLSLQRKATDKFENILSDLDKNQRCVI